MFAQQQQRLWIAVAMIAALVLLALSAARPTTGAGSEARYVVQPGDTLFSLSRLYYNSPDKWKAILDANEKSIDDPGKLKVGQTLTIP